VAGETIAEAPDASSADVEAAVAAARRAQPKWAALSAWDRAEICHAIADLIEERREEFACQRCRSSRGSRMRPRRCPSAFRYLDHLRVGNVVVNDSTDYWEAHEPFGGAGA
jgi:acyl-CoA reductase-like NAD-dependent aldehyde dehydrogenase